MEGAAREGGLLQEQEKAALPAECAEISVPAEQEWAFISIQKGSEGLVTLLKMTSNGFVLF